MARRSERIKNLQQVMQKPQPEKSIDVSSSKEDSAKELSDIESEEDTYDIMDDEEQSAESEEEETAHASTRGTGSLESRFKRGKNYFQWSITPPTEKQQTEADKVPNYEPEVLCDAKNKTSPIEIWSLLFTDKMLNRIVEYTNAEIARKRENYKTLENYLSDIDLEELKAFIGILYFGGLHREDYKSVETLWGSGANSAYRSIMKRSRFRFLLQCLQFNEESTRQECRQRDNLAPIRDLWNLFILNCTKYYSPGKNVTIGEQLLYFCGKCDFRVNMGTKPEKWGLKIVMMNDSRTFYMINAIPYVGKVDTRPQESMPSYYVRKLSEPIHNSHRNITCNKRFISVPLVQNMKDNFSLSVVGTIKTTEKEIPREMKSHFTIVNDSHFLYANNMTLLSYCPKRSKTVLVLSSLHERGNIAVGEKPDIIKFYNSTKGGTNKFDQMCRDYSTAVRRSHRWPMRFFYGMLDQGGYNSFILYNLNKEGNKITREKFLETLAKNLYTPFIKTRLRLRSGITDELQSLMKNIIEGKDSES